MIDGRGRILVSVNTKQTYLESSAMSRTSSASQVHLDSASERILPLLISNCGTLYTAM